MIFSLNKIDGKLYYVIDPSNISNTGKELVILEAEERRRGFSQSVATKEALAYIANIDADSPFN